MVDSEALHQNRLDFEENCYVRMYIPFTNYVTTAKLGYLRIFFTSTHSTSSSISATTNPLIEKRCLQPTSTLNEPIPPVFLEANAFVIMIGIIMIVIKRKSAPYRIPTVSIRRSRAASQTTEHNRCAALGSIPLHYKHS